MKILNQKIVKINKENSISILEWSNGEFEIAHLLNGEVVYGIISDVITVSADKLEETIEDLALEIVAAELNEDFDVEIVETSIKIETFTYNVWIDVAYSNNKIQFLTETSHLERLGKSDEFQDSVANQQIRKTFKGLVNFIERFDK